MHTHMDKQFLKCCKLVSEYNRAACLSHPKALVLSSIIMKKQPVMCALILYLGHTHTHTNAYAPTKTHTSRVCAHGAEAETGLVSISYEQLMNRHDAHVSKGAGTKS